MRHAWTAAAIAAGAAMLAWPAVLNGYPLLFSDTGGFLHQTLGPLMLWDKPWVYGPLLHALHWRVSLWLPLVAQAVMVAWVIAVVVRVTERPPPQPSPATAGEGEENRLPAPSPAVAGEGWGGGVAAIATLALCAFAAFLTTAPFTVSLLMPDVFAPVIVLALFLLGPARAAIGRGEAIVLGVLAALGIAAHLAHVPLAAALVLATLLVTRSPRAAVRTALPLLAALALVFATNLVGHGRLSLSAHGATFLLARLQADGPGAETIRARCPEAGWYLCAFADRLPIADSDEFLWDRASPVNRDAAGEPRFLGGATLSAEAREIVAATIADRPFEVAAAMLRNTLRQLALVEAGDTLGPDHLATAVRPRIAEGFSARELAVYDAALQARGLLREAAAPFTQPHLPVLLAALALVPVALWRAVQAGQRPRLALLVLVLVGCAANAVATGALSKPVPRYEARIAWLLPLAVALALIPARRRPA